MKWKKQSEKEIGQKGRSEVYISVAGALESPKRFEWLEFFSGKQNMIFKLLSGVFLDKSGNGLKKKPIGKVKAIMK